MTQTEVEVKLEGHDHEIKSLKHRMGEQEELNKTTQELVLSVKELALNMQAMIREQSEQGKRLAKLEQEPAERWNSASRIAFNTIIGAISGAFVTGVVYMVAQNIQ